MVTNRKGSVPWGDRKDKMTVPLSGVNVVAKNVQNEQRVGPHWCTGDKAESRRCEG